MVASLIFFNAKHRLVGFFLRGGAGATVVREHTPLQDFSFNRFVAPERLRLNRTRVLDFILASFVFVLNYRHYATLSEPVAQVRVQTKAFNPNHGLHSVHSLRFLWYSWSNFLSTLFSLSVRRCSLIILVSSKLRLIAQAMSWYTFAGAYVRWKSLIRFLDQPKSSVLVAEGVCTDASASILLLRPVTSYTAFAILRKMRSPVLGYGGTVLSEQLLWQSAGFYSTDLNFQYLSLITFWAFFIKCCS